MTVHLVIHGHGIGCNDTWWLMIGPGPKTLSVASILKDKAAVAEYLEQRWGFGLSREQLDHLWDILDRLLLDPDFLEGIYSTGSSVWKDNTWYSWWKTQIINFGYVPKAGGALPLPIHVPSPPLHVGGSIFGVELPEQLARLRDDPEPAPVHLGTARSPIFATTYPIQGIDVVAHRVGGADPSIRPIVRAEPPAPPRLYNHNDLLTDEELERNEPDSEG